MRGAGLTVNVHGSVREACAVADIIVTTTPSQAPILEAADLPEGHASRQHVVQREKCRLVHYAYHGAVQALSMDNRFLK